MASSLSDLKNKKYYTEIGIGYGVIILAFLVYLFTYEYLERDIRQMTIRGIFALSAIWIIYTGYITIYKYKTIPRLGFHPHYNFPLKGNMKNLMGMILILMGMSIIINLFNL